ncbi:hypothetical protein DRE_03989 [Drechslerella stenobrocha 248]|uniref:Uncharacterized protein n=1 Tax=Drechslerella stenobrocha 248 TaxID=1043628 RepID=W7HTL0_9PEZI|nr:hypothetical protein DRE_03989 [Drechslerella stenobrocha 248]
MDITPLLSPAVINRLQELTGTSFLHSASINNYPRPTETHLDTVDAAEKQHQSSVMQDVETLGTLIKGQEDAVRQFQTQLTALQKHEDATPGKVDAAKARGLKNGFERFFAQLPWLPEEDSGLNTLLAVRTVLRIIEESRKEITETERRVEETKQVVRREQGWVATAVEIEKQLKRRIAELEKVSQSDVSQEARDKMKLREYEETRKETEAVSRKLANELGEFVRENLGVMLAVEEAGGPVVGSELDIEELKQYLSIEEGSSTKKGKAAKARERGQKRLDELWGGGGGEDGKETTSAGDKAGEELLGLVETMLNKMLEDDPHAYTKLSRDSAASRFLIRSFVATLHPKDAMRIRLLDFAGKLEGGR